MRGSFTVAGIEVAIRSERGPLERALLAVLEPYLGDVRAPVCRISVHPADAGLVAQGPATAVGLDGGLLHFEDGVFSGTIDPCGDGAVDVIPTPAGVIHCLRLVWSTVALRHGAVLMAASGVLSGARAHLVLHGDGPLLRRLASAQRLAMLSTSQVALASTGTGWIAATTPFDGEPLAAPRSAPVAAIWFADATLDQEVAPLGRLALFKAVLERGVTAPGEPQTRQLLFDRAAELAGAVPAGALRLDQRTTWSVVDGLGAALSVRQALLAWEQPVLSARALHDAGTDGPDGVTVRRRGTRRPGG
jgi:hypothetical protein